MEETHRVLCRSDEKVFGCQTRLWALGAYLTLSLASVLHNTRRVSSALTYSCLSNYWKAGISLTPTRQIMVSLFKIPKVVYKFIN